MPRSIIDIDVNDERFKAFLELYQKWQASAAEQPAVWGEVNETVAAIGAGFSVVTAELAAQFDETKKLTAAEKERAEEAKKRGAEEAKQAATETASQRRRKTAIEDSKKLLGNIRDTTVELSKWAVLGGVASFAGGALSFWGLDNLVSYIGRERTLAQGLGVTTGERQALGLRLSPYIDVNSALGNIATAQQTPSSRWLFSSFGVNPNGKDPAQLLAEMAPIAGRIFAQSGNNLLYAQARGLTQIFDPETLRRLAKDQGEVGRAGRQAAADWAPGGALYLSDRISREWQQFIVNLDVAGTTLKNTLINKLSELDRSGALDDIIKSFTQLGVYVLDQIDWRAAGIAVKTFANYLESPKFLSDFKTFVDDTSYAANKMVGILRLLGLIPDSVTSAPSGAGVPNASVGAPPGGARISAKSGAIGAGVGFIAGGPVGAALGGAIGSGAGAAAVYTRAHGYAAEQWAAQNLLKWGWTPAQAAGIIENVRAEDASWNPFAVGDSGLAYGIGQWHGNWKDPKTRQGQYYLKFGHTMQSVTDPAQALREQLEFIQWEMTHTYKKAGDDLRHARSAYQAGYIVSKEYERPRGGRLEAMRRGVGAQMLVDVQVHNQTGSNVSTGVFAMAH